jgi:hypothetical protein
VKSSTTTRIRKRRVARQSETKSSESVFIIVDEFLTKAYEDLRRSREEIP